MVAGDLAIGAGMGLATRGSANSQAAMLNVQSIAKLADDEPQRLGESVRKTSLQVTQSAVDLANGLYDIVSSGLTGAIESQLILDQAALGASAGMTSTAVAAQANLAVLNSYDLSAQHAADVNDTLFKTVDVGIITFEELAAGMGEWTATAAAVGIAADEAAAAIAATSLAGTQGPQAATNLNRPLQSFIDPTTELTAVAKHYSYETAHQYVADRRVVWRTPQARPSHGW